LLRPIGQGAYGEVWLARNVMGALRAVKIISRRQFESARPFERELAGVQRYEPVSRSSGGLVHVLHVGKNDAEGYFYYVMELADNAAGASRPQAEAAQAITPPGSEARPEAPHLDALALRTGSGFWESYEPRTLRSDVKRSGRLPTADCLRLAIEVTSGLAHLHRHGLVHRDVKPGNIIFVDNRAKLADIGLITGQGEGRTFVGTEGYIPPEGPGTAAADLYALGVVLYEASTGFSPERFPDAPSEWVTEPGGDEALELHEIILKACEGQRERRYPDTQALQADLARLQSGQSVRRVRTLERRYARLRQTGLVGTTLLVIAVVAALFAGYRARLAADSNAKEILLRQSAQESQARAEAAERQARQQLYTALLEQARATVRSGELGQRVRALDAIRRAAALSNTAELRGAAVAAMALPDWRFERQWPKPAETTLVQLDPSFKRLALCRGSGPVEIHAASDQRLLATLPASTNLPVYFARWSPDGQFLAVIRDRPDSDNLADLEVWHVASQRRLLLVQAITYNSVAFHPHSPRIMAALDQGGIAVWDLQNGIELQHFKLEEVPRLLAISPDGGRFAAGCEGGKTPTVSIYRLADGSRLMSHALEDTVGGIDWHPDGRWLAAADCSGAVQLLDTETGQARLLGRHKVQAVLAQFSPDGDHLLTAGWEREFICWDVRRMARAFTIGLNSYRAQFRADGRECAVVTDTDVQLHAVERPTVCREFSEELGPRLLRAAFSPDGRWLAAAASQRLGVWDLTRHDLGAVLPQGAQARLFFSSQGDLFASADDRGYRWQVTPAPPGSAPRLEPVAVFDPPGFVSLCLASNQVVLTDQRGSCALALDEAATPQRHWRATVRGFSTGSPDGQWLAVFPSFAWSLNVYRIPTFEPVATLANLGSISAVEFSPSGDEVAVSTSRTVEIWSTSNWHRIRQLNFIGLHYSPGARTLWLTKDYSTAGLYDAKALQLLLPLPLGVHPMAISADGRLLAASVDTRRLQVWDLSEVREHLRDLGLEW